MKIKDLRVRTCSIPIEAPTRHSYASPNFYTRTIVELITDEQLNGEPVIGLGETYGTVSAKYFDPIRPVVIGADPYDLESILTKIRQRGYISHKPMLAAPIEFACLDLQGKAAGLPVYKLLGGKIREAIDISAYIFFRYANNKQNIEEVRTPDQVVDYTQKLVDTYGFKTLKLKGGVFQPQDELQVLQALRETFPLPDYQLRYDPNAILSVSTAIQLGHQMADLHLEYYEDPTWGIKGMQKVGSKVPQPLATNMAVIEFDNLPLAAEQDAFDIVLSDLWYYGGCRITKHVDFSAPHMGLAVGMHSGVEFGLGLTTMLHCAITMPNLVHAIDSHYHHLTDDILKNPLQYKNGKMIPPNKPGWGVELNEAKIDKYEKLCIDLRSGKLNGHHDTEDYYSNPPDPKRSEWFPKVPSW